MNPSPETLVEHSAMTADKHMADAIKYIDNRFGKGYAKKNPQLVGSFMKTAAIDFAAGFVAHFVAEEIRNRN